MAANSPYDALVAQIPGVQSFWPFRDQSTLTATATIGAVNGTYTGAFGQGVVSPLARDQSTPLGVYSDVLGGVHLGASVGPYATTAGYVTFGDNYDFAGVLPFSVSTLVRLRGDVPNGYTWAEMEIVDKTPTASRNGWDLAITANRQVIFRRWVAGVAESATATTSLIPQLWYHIVATYNGTTLAVYVDDAPPMSAASVGSLPGNAINLTIGGQNGGSTALLDADVGPTAIYNRALAAPEVLALFNAALVAGTAAQTYYLTPTGSDAARPTMNNGDPTAASNATPIVITVPSWTTQPTVGQMVVVAGILGNTSANGVFAVQAVSSTTVTLANSLGTGTFSASAGATIKPLGGTPTDPWASYNKATSTAMAGDTCIFAYAAGVPYVETTVRNNSVMAFTGTKRAAIVFTSDQTSPYTNKPVIQFGTLSTGTAVGTAGAGTVWATNAITYAVSNTLTAGQSYVTVTGASPSGYNVTDALVTSRDSTHITVARSTDPGAWSSGGTVTTGIDLTNGAKSHILQQCYHTIRGLYFTQPMMGSDFNDRLLAFFGQEYHTGINTVTAGTVSAGLVVYTTPAVHGLAVGRTVTITGLGSSGGSYNISNGTIQTVGSTTTFTVAVPTATGTPSGTGWLTAEMQGEVQTITVTAGATGTIQLTLPGSSQTGTISVTATAATVQTALRASVSASTGSALIGQLSNVICTGGPLGTAAVNIIFTATQQLPYSVGPMPQITTTQPATGTATTARTTAGSNGTRWYQSADFCTAEYLTMENAYAPYKSALDCGSTFRYNTVLGTNVGIGCYNSNAPTFANNLFLMNASGKALRNGGFLQQVDGIQSKGGTRNAQIVNNVVHVPTGHVMNGVGFYVGGGSNDMDGLYDFTTAGKEGYNNIAINNVAVADDPMGIGFTPPNNYTGAGFMVGGGSNDTVAYNIAVNCAVGGRVSWGGNWPTMGALAATHPKSSSVTMVNNIWYAPLVFVGTTTSITEASTTVTYVVPNTLAAGQMVWVRGADVAAYNISAGVVATASASQFTVTFVATGLAAAGVQGSVFAGQGYGFAYNAGETSDRDVTTPFVYSNNLRYGMGLADFAIANGSAAANDIGANIVDPLFIDPLSDWHTLPGSPVARQGIVPVRSTFGQGFLRRAMLDMSVDVAGEQRPSSATDLGIYAASLGYDTNVNVINGSTVSGVEVFNVGHGAIGSGTEALRQTFVQGDPSMQGSVARVSPNGQALALPYSLHENLVNGNPAVLTTTGAATLFAAAGSNLRTYITDLIVINSHATVGTLVTIADAGGTIWQGYAAAGGGGAAPTFPAPRRQSQTNAAITVTCGTTGANVYVSAGGYVSV